MDEAGRAAARAELAGAIDGALTAWERGHPRATLDELVDAVDGELARLRTRYLEDLAATAAADEARWPACPRCGGELVRRGRRRRAVLIPKQGVAVSLERPYGVCPSCGTGLFPPR